MLRSLTCPKDPGELWRASEQRSDRARVLEALCLGMGWRPAWRRGAQQGAGCGDPGVEPPGLDVPATEKRRKSRFGVSADVLGICALSLGGPREVWMGQVIGRPLVGEGEGACGWLEKRKEPGGGPVATHGDLWLTSIVIGVGLWLLCGCHPGDAGREPILVQ